MIESQLGHVQEALPHRRPAMNLFSLACALAAPLIVAVLIPDWSGWTTPLLLIVPGLLTLVVARSSLISAGHLFQITLYFGAASLILGSHWEPRLVSAVLAWSLAVAVGTLLGRPTVRRKSPASRLGPRWPHYALCGGLIGLSAFLTLSAKTGYAAQIASGLSTPTGILGTLAVASPIITLTLLLSSIGSGGRSRLAIGLAVMQLIVLGLSGFRGAGAVLILSIILGAGLTLPHLSNWRGKSRLFVLLPVLLIITIFTIVLGASIKNTAAAELGVSSSGTRLFTVDNASTTIASRLQLGSSLDTAIKYRDVAKAKDAVSWEDQLRAAVPRLLWPDKPVVDYGQRVSVAMYGLTYGQSSSTVTTIGDSLLNFGLGGVAFAGLLAGLALSKIEARVRWATKRLSVLLVAVLVYSVVGSPEQPLVLIIIGVLRNILVCGALWAAAALIADRRKTRKR